MEQGRKKHATYRAKHTNRSIMGSQYQFTFANKKDKPDWKRKEDDKNMTDQKSCPMSMATY